MFNLSDDDSFSTQLEGKKLKNRGAYLETKRKNGYAHDGELLEIDVNAPGAEVEGQEYFIEREYGKENEQEREERLKVEMQAARLQQLELQRQQQLQQQSLQVSNPNLALDQIEQGMMLSQNKGKPVIEQKFKQHDSRDESLHSRADIDETKAMRKTDMAVASFALGENAKNLNFSDDIKISEKGNAPKGSIPATQVQDIREKSGPGVVV